MDDFLERENKQLASFSQRILAYSIDYLVIMIIAFIILSQSEAAKQIERKISDPHYYAKIINDRLAATKSDTRLQISPAGDFVLIKAAQPNGEDFASGGASELTPQNREGYINSDDFASGDFGVAPQNRSEFSSAAAGANAASMSANELVLEAIMDDIMQLAPRMSILLLCLKAGYLAIFLAASGQTIGCMLAKIRHVNISDFGTASYLNALIKAILWVLIDSFFFGALFLLALNNGLKQTLADKIAKQVIIRV